MAGSELRDLRGRIENIRKELHTILEQAGPDLDMSRVTQIEGDSTTKVAYMQALNTELDELHDKSQPLENAHAAVVRAQQQLQKFGDPVGNHPGFPMPGEMQVPQPGVVTIGKAVTDAWKETGGLKHDRSYNIDIGDMPIKSLAEIGLKTTLSTSAGFAPQAIRTGQVIPFATRPIQLIDLLPSGNTDQSAVVYMEETTFTPAAVETAEAGTYPEAALAYTERNVPVRKIPVFIPVTDEQLEDVGQVQGLLNQRLPFFIRQRLDGQILNGNGTSPNLFGILNVSGIQTQARSTDPGPDCVYKAIVKVRVTGRALPNAVILHPTDWQNIRLLRTADGLYIYGNPADDIVPRMWGLPVAESDAGSAGTAVVGDFAGFSSLVERRGIEVKVSDSHSDFFIKGTQAIRADMRCAIVWYRPAAFCTCTGM